VPLKLKAIPPPPGRSTISPLGTPFVPLTVTLMLLAFI
jgi:hypothetical protein